MKEIRHLKTMKNKRNLNTKWLLLQNDQNADTTLLHSHDDLSCLYLSVLLLDTLQQSQIGPTQRGLKRPTIALAPYS